jgi:penicillin-binding protein 1A
MASKAVQNYYINVVKWLWKGFLIIVILIPLFFLSVKINLFNLYGGLPSLRDLENPDPDIASVILSADGDILGKYAIYNRSPVDYEELSPYLVQGLVATEDRRYYSHSGIDLVGLMRAFINSFVLQRNREGGSTITQQLAKMLWETRSERYEGYLSENKYLNHLIIKTKEWLVAIQIERSYTKNEIISMYFNTMPFGNNTFGVRVAALTYFNKLPSELDIHEAALLVGIVNGPSLFNPIRHPERATRRRNWVIRQLYTNNYINRELYENNLAKDLSLNITREDHTEGMATYFRAVLREELRPWARTNGINLDRDGVKIYTSIDSRIQKHAEDAVKKHMAWLQEAFNREWNNSNPWDSFGGDEYVDRVWKRSGHYLNLIKKYGMNSDSLEIMAREPQRMRVFTWSGEKDTIMTPLDSIKHYKKMLQTGFMAMEPHSGQIKAWVGGIDIRHFQYDHVKMGKNQPGSTFKPILYATAVENGYSPCFPLKDAPVTYPNPGGSPPFWTPENSSEKYNGETMTMRQALARSINRIAASMIQRVGIDNVVDMAQRLGISSALTPVMSLSLGSSDVSLMEMVGAYSVFVNDGVWIEPHALLRIEDKYGNILYEASPKSRDAISDETAYTMLYMLRGLVEEEGGTGQGLDPFLRQDNEIGGKTGTTSDHADGWFIGVTEDLVAGAWVGGDDRAIRFKNIQHGQGAVMAMPIWEKFMINVYKDSRTDDGRPKTGVKVLVIGQGSRYS